MPHSTAFGLEHAGGGRHEWRVSLAASGGGQWDVRVTDGGGEVVGKRRGSGDEAAVHAVQGARISAAEALRLATERDAGAELLSLGLGHGEGGRPVWRVGTDSPSGAGTSGSPGASGSSASAAPGAGGGQETRLDARTGRLLEKRSGK